MNDLTMTVTGWVATEPKFVVTRDGSGTPMCTFRIAQTARYFDRNANTWANGNTEWFSVRVFRDGARLVADSIHKGQPVIVEGRLRTNEWKDSEGETHWDLQLDASCVGHDLTKGIANFTRAVVTAGEDEGADEAAAAGAPDGEALGADEDLTGDEAEGVDLETADGEEVRERPAALV